MGYISNPSSTSTSSRVVLTNDFTTTDVTGTTLGTVDTYTGLSVAADDMLIITVVGEKAGGTGRPRMVLTLGDGSNTDAFAEFQWGNQGTGFNLATITIGQQETGSTTKVICAVGTSTTSVGGGTSYYESCQSITLANISSWADVTQIKMEIKDTAGGGTTSVHHVMIEKFSASN